MSIRRRIVPVCANHSAVYLSYAPENTAAAQRIAEALARKPRRGNDNADYAPADAM